MGKKIILLVIHVIIGATVYGQNRDSIEAFLTKFQKVAFVTPDSVYTFTKFIDANGGVDFSEGFDSSADSNYLHNSIFYTDHGVYRFLYENYPLTVDTIYSYFPIRKIEYAKIEFTEDSINSIEDELGYSYILKQLGEPIDLSANTVRLTYPYYDTEPSNLYEVVTIKFFADSAQIYNISAGSVDFNGIQSIRRDSCLLKRRDVEKIMKLLCNVVPVSDMCTQPSNRWILEYNDGIKYEHYVISDFCFSRLSRRDGLSLRPITLLYYSITNIRYKYFGASFSYEDLYTKKHPLFR